MRRLASASALLLLACVSGVACSSSKSTAPAAAPAYNVVTAVYDGSVLSVVRVGADEGGPVSPAPNPGAPFLAWEFDDVSGTSLASGTIADPTFVTAEFAADGTSNPFTTRGAALIEVRVPASEGTLNISDGADAGTVSGQAFGGLGDNVPASGSVHALNANANVGGAVTPSTVPGLSKLLDNGACAPFNILIVSEGFQTGDMPSFESTGKAIAAGLADYKGYSGKLQDFNLWALEVPSVDSGINDPGCTAPGPPNLDPCGGIPAPPAVKRNTAFGATYGDNVTIARRAITVPSSSAGNQAAFATLANAKRAARADIVAFIVNDPGNDPRGLGGSANIAGKSFTASTYTDAYNSVVATTAHESGHALFGLADEYSNGADAAGCAMGKSLNSGPFPLINVTTTPQTPPWKSLLTTTMLPTTGIDEATVGAFVGGYYCGAGYYRSQVDCLMRSPVGDARNTHGDFCAACLDHFNAIVAEREMYAKCACPGAMTSGTGGSGLVQNGGALVCPTATALAQQATTNGWWKF